MSMFWAHSRCRFVISHFQFTALLLLLCGCCWEPSYYLLYLLNVLAREQGRIAYLLFITASCGLPHFTPHKQLKLKKKNKKKAKTSVRNRFNIKETVHPQNQKHIFFFLLACSAVYPSGLFRCERCLPSLEYNVTNPVCAQTVVL